MKTISIWLLGCFIALAALSGCAPQEQAHSVRGETMGTFYNVRYFGPTRLALDAAIDNRLQQLDASLSTYKTGSEVSLFNASKANQWFPVSASTAEIVALAQSISLRSDGAFDITIGPLVELWGFGSGPFQSEPPPAELIRERLSHVGYQNISVRNNPPALRKSHPATAIDLSAIAKGYAVDQLAELLDDAGVDAWLIEVGGELRTRGSKTAGQPWQVGIEKPIANERSAQRVISLRNAAIATSGDYRNFFEFNGVRYSHSINPLTGWPVPDNIGSVSVIANDAMTADAWATALLVKGSDEALQLAEANALAISIIQRGADGKFTEQLSPAFAALLNN